MNFRINESDSSLPSILLYLALLSFVGGSLGMYAKKRLNHASQKAELSVDYAKAQEQIEMLRAKIKAEAHTLAELKSRSRKQEQDLAQWEAQWNEASRKCEDLRTEQTVLTQAIRDAKEACNQQITRYRVITWKSAEGETRSEIKTVHGKVYRNVTIKRVTVDGVEISHDGGPGRLAPEVLDRTWHERFQWRTPPP